VDTDKNREYCLTLLQQYTKSDSLLKHAYAVETCVRAYAEKLNEDVEYWGNVALLHDFDYENIRQLKIIHLKVPRFYEHKVLMKNL